MKLTYIALLFSLAVFISCKQESFTRDVVPATPHQPWLYKQILVLADSLKLDKIENGFDSLQIRIWADPPWFKRKVAIFKKDANGWASSLVIYEPHFLNENSDSVTFYEKSAIPPSHKMQWNKFMDSLNCFNIINLEDKSHIQGYQHSTDRISYFVEVSTKRMYRLYSFHCPEDSTQFTDAKRMTEILKFIERNTGYAFIAYPPLFKR